MGKRCRHHSDLDLYAALSDSVHHGVRFHQVAGERFLHQDVRPGLGGGRDHLQAMVQGVGTDCDQVWGLLAEHFAVVAVTLLCSGVGHDFFSAGGVRVGDGYDVDGVEGIEGLVPTVTVAAHAGVTDYGGAVFFVARIET